MNKKPELPAHYKPARLGGCIICNSPVKQLGDLCDDCYDTDFRDPLYPENHPKSQWQRLHGQKDMWEQILGPADWPYPAWLIRWIENSILDPWPSYGIEHGALISRGMPANIRLAGAYVLRKLCEEGELEPLLCSYTGGFYFRSTK